MGTGRKGRSCAWSPSRGVTSKSPMHAGAASSLSLHARLARLARQRRRCYQSGKGRATNRGGPGCRQAHRWPVSSGRDLPRPEPRQRPGPAYEFSFAGRSAVFRRRRFGPALLRKALRCSCPAIACGDRGVSDSTWAAGLLFGADGVAVTVSLDRTAGMPPRPPRLPPDEHHDGAYHRLVGAGHRDAGEAQVRRPRDAPATLDRHQPQPRRHRHTAGANDRRDLAVRRRHGTADGTEVRGNLRVLARGVTVKRRDAAFEVLLQDRTGGGVPPRTPAAASSRPRRGFCIVFSLANQPPNPRHGAACRTYTLSKR